MFPQHLVKPAIQPEQTNAGERFGVPLETTIAEERLPCPCGSGSDGQWLAIGNKTDVSLKKVDHPAMFLRGFKPFPPAQVNELGPLCEPDALVRIQFTNGLQPVKDRGIRNGFSHGGTRLRVQSSLPSLIDMLLLILSPARGESHQRSRLAKDTGGIGDDQRATAIGFNLEV